MILFLILFFVFAGITAACWFQGLWSSAINVINLLLAGLIATNFWEPAATAIDGATNSEHSYLLDAALLWAMFAVSYIILRLLTHSLSEHHVEFIKPVDLVGRSIFAIWCGWIFTCFTAFTMLTAPIGAAPLGAWDTPDAKSFMFLAPEREWLAFCQSRSMGALSRGRFSGTTPRGDDASLGAEVFDPNAEFTFKYRARRAAAEN